MESFQMSKKDRVIFCTKADHEVPSKFELPPQLPNERRPGVVLPNGEINWTCPCLGNLSYGPCGFEFREFFGCLHKAQEIAKGQQQQQESENDNLDSSKAQECYPKFTSMKSCFSRFPKLYPPDEDDDLIESTNKLKEDTPK